MSEAHPNLNRVFHEFRLRKIPIWAKVLLFFKPKYVALDWEDNDTFGYVLFYKYLFGKVYVVGEEMRPNSNVV